MTKKQNKFTEEEAFVEVFKSCLDYIHKTDELDLKIIENDIKFIQQEIKFKEDEEPLKFFKKAHNKWESELEELELKLANTYKKLNDEIVSQIEFYKKLKD